MEEPEDEMEAAVLSTEHRRSTLEDAQAKMHDLLNIAEDSGYVLIKALETVRSDSIYTVYALSANPDAWDTECNTENLEKSGSYILAKFYDRELTQSNMRGNLVIEDVDEYAGLEDADEFGDANVVPAWEPVKIDLGPSGTGYAYCGSATQDPNFNLNELVWSFSTNGPGSAILRRIEEVVDAIQNGKYVCRWEAPRMDL
jgi:hypothetical protein